MTGVQTCAFRSYSDIKLYIDDAGNNPKAYDMRIFKLGNDATLEALQVENTHELDPAFNKSVYNYKIDSKGKRKLVFPLIKATDPKASVKIIAAAGAKTKISDFIGSTSDYEFTGLEPGNNVMKIQVTSADGTVSNTYTVRVHYEAADDDIRLYDIRLAKYDADGNVIEYMPLTPMFENHLQSFDYVIESK